MDHYEKRRKDYAQLDQVKAQSSKPLINEKAPTSIFSFGFDRPTAGLPQTSNSPMDYKSLWELFLASPEAIAPCDAIITDFVADGYKIEPIKDGDDAAVKKATEFLDANQFKQLVLPSLLLDELVTGDCYLYMTRVSKESFTEAVKAIAKKLPLKNSKSREYLYYAMADEDTFKTKQLIPVASSTLKLLHDNHGNIQKYLQAVGPDMAEFTPKDIIHWKYFNLNGKVYGYCPMKAVVPELTMLAAIKDAAGYQFENGGMPGHMFNLEEEVPNSPNVKFLQEQLKDLRDNLIQHRNLITTGKVRIDTFENKNSEMEYRELMEQLTRIIYTAWGVPAAKMGQSTEESGAYDAGLATEQYYRRISHHQDRFYSHFNAQLMIPEFGVRIVPPKTYLQDELRESQMVKQKFDIAEQGFNNGWVTEDWVVDYLEIPEKWKGDFENKQFQQEQQNLYMQGQMKNKDVNQTNPEKDVNKMRSDTQKQKSKPKEKAKALLEGKGFTEREIEAILYNDNLESS